MIILNKLPLFPPPVVGLDIETTGLDRFNCDIRAIGISDGETTWILTEDFARVVPLLEDPDTLKIIQNSTFDLTVLAYWFGCRPVNIWDTLVVERVIWNGYDFKNGLDDVVARRLGIVMDKTVRQSFVDYYGPLSQEQLEYLEKDCIYLGTIRQQQIKDIWERQLERVVKLENRLIPVVLDMTLTGVGFKEDVWKEIKKDIEAVMKDLIDKMKSYLGEDFYVEVEAVKNHVSYTKHISVDEIKWTSNPQMNAVIAKVLGKKLDSIGKKVLEYFKNNEFIATYMDYVFWRKMYGWKWKDDIDKNTGRIHPSWNQVGTDTGRFSCNGPNLQNVPRPNPDPKVPNLRRLFSALPGHKFISLDYSQQEPRLLAAVSGDPKMIEAANEQDIYCAFARDVWGEVITKKDPRRQLIKTLVLAFFYGSTAESAAKKFNLPLEEVIALRDAVLSTYPVAALWGDRQLSQVYQYGYSKTLSGRKRFYPDVHNTPKNMEWRISNMSKNAPIQGSGGDLAKLAMCKMYEVAHKYNAHIMMMIHDEIVVSVDEKYADEFFPIALRCMEDAGKELAPQVKFLAEGKVSDTWEH